MVQSLVVRRLAVLCYMGTVCVRISNDSLLLHCCGVISFGMVDREEREVISLPDHMLLLYHPDLYFDLCTCVVIKPM